MTHETAAQDLPWELDESSEPTYRPPLQSPTDQFIQSVIPSGIQRYSQNSRSDTQLTRAFSQMQLIEIDAAP